MSEAGIQGAHPALNRCEPNYIKDEQAEGQAKKRRLQDMLHTAGTGVIAFCVWSLAKIVLFLSAVDADTLHQLLGINVDSITVAVYIALCILTVFELCIHAYVGLSARAEGRGEKRGAFYLIVAVILAIANASSLFVIANSTTFASVPLNMIVSIVIEATAVAMLVVVPICSIRLRRMGAATE